MNRSQSDISYTLTLYIFFAEGCRLQQWYDLTGDTHENNAPIYTIHRSFDFEQEPLPG